MSVSFRILPSLGLVYVRYDGHAKMHETLDVFANYVQHPDFQPGQKHFVDLSRLTGWDEDYLELMKAQAKKAEAFTTSNSQTLIIYYAPTPLAQKLARIVLRSWEPFPSVVPIVQDSEDQALSILGLTHQNLDQMLRHAG